MTDDERALAELYGQRFAFASEDAFYAIWRSLGDVRGRQVAAKDVDEKFSGLFDISDLVVDGAFMDFVSDEIKCGASPPDDCSFGEMVHWALRNRLNEKERRNRNLWRVFAWGVAIAVVAVVISKLFRGTG